MAWHEMIEVPFKKEPYEFHLHGLCDLQLGSSSTSLSVIKTRIKEILDDPVDSGVIIPGDIEDEDRPSTRAIRQSVFSDRYEVISRDANKHRDWLDDHVIPLLLPLQKTKYGIMGILAGHHWTQISPAQNSVQYICQELSRLSGKRVPYMGIMLSYLEIRFVKTSGRSRESTKKLGLIMHGEGGGQTKASAIQKIERAAQGFEGDFFIRGHDTQLLATKTDKLFPKECRGAQPEMRSKTIVYLNLGASTQGYNMTQDQPSYVEEKIMRPTTMGWGTIKFLMRNAHPWEDSNKNSRCVMKVEI